MKAGKHVYSAVPAAKSLEECDALVNTVKQTGLIYMMGETSYFRPETAFCRKKAEEGAFGRFVHCRAEYFHDLSHGLYEVARNRWGEHWGRDKSGDIPMHYPTHSICFPVSVMKARMTEVSAQGFIYPNVYASSAGSVIQAANVPAEYTGLKAVSSRTWQAWFGQTRMENMS